MNEDCIFCKIIEGKIPSDKIYEDNDFVAFLDIHPVSLGHTLIIPKNHYEWMHKTPDDIVSGGFVTTKKIMQAMISGLSCDYVQVSVVGKDVPHFHVHLIPRTLDDGIKQSPTISYKDDDEKKLYQDKIKSAL